MNDQIELPAVSMANTKKELLDAYEEAKKSFDGEKNVLVGKIEALEKMAASQAALIADLSKKSELAYEKVQDIANRAVTAARRESYVPPVQHASVAVRDDKQG
jgi:hypothetical protein